MNNESETNSLVSRLLNSKTFPALHEAYHGVFQRIRDENITSADTGLIAEMKKKIVNQGAQALGLVYNHPQRKKS